jgi:predicted ester cyclase
MSEENKALVRGLVEELQVKHDLSAIDRYCSPSFVDHDDESDREGAKAFFAMFFSAFPDLRAEIHDQVAEGDKVVTRKTFHATHIGEFFGISASNRPIDVQVIDILRIGDGKVTEHWSAMDMMGLMQQIGAIPNQ